MPIHGCVQGPSDRRQAIVGTFENAKSQKGPASRHIKVQQGAVLDANKTCANLEGQEKEKGLQSPKLGPVTARRVAVGRSGVFPTVDEQRQAQSGDSTVVRVEPGMGAHSPSQRVTSDDPGTSSQVVARGHQEGSLDVRMLDHATQPAADSLISSAVRIRGSVLELAGRVNGYPARVLIDSGATGNFISDRLITAMELNIEPEDDEEELTLANGSVVRAKGIARF